MLQFNRILKKIPRIPQQSSIKISAISFPPTFNISNKIEYKTHRFPKTFNSHRHIIQTEHNGGWKSRLAPLIN